MREILFRGKNIDLQWIEGDLLQNGVDYKTAIRDYEERLVERVISHTVGQYTGLTDSNGKKIFEGDIVEFLGSKYQVVFECGSFGIAGVSDWEAIEKQIPISTGCDNDLCACLNDNYISLWEIFWNLENNHGVLDTVKIIGNIHDNPELLN